MKLILPILGAVLTIAGSIAAVQLHDDAQWPIPVTVGGICLLLVWAFG